MSIKDMDMAEFFRSLVDHVCGLHKDNCTVVSVNGDTENHHFELQGLELALQIVKLRNPNKEVWERDGWCLTLVGDPWYLQVEIDAQLRKVKNIDYLNVELAEADVALIKMVIV